MRDQLLVTGLVAAVASGAVYEKAWREKREARRFFEDFLKVKRDGVQKRAASYDYTTPGYDYYGPTGRPYTHGYDYNTYPPPAPSAYEGSGYDFEGSGYDYPTTYPTEAPASAFDTWASIGPIETPSHTNEGYDYDAEGFYGSSANKFIEETVRAYMEQLESATPAPHHRKRDYPRPTGRPHYDEITSTPRTYNTYAPAAPSDRPYYGSEYTTPRPYRTYAPSAHGPTPAGPPYYQGSTSGYYRKKRDASYDFDYNTEMTPGYDSYEGPSTVPPSYEREYNQEGSGYDFEGSGYDYPTTSGYDSYENDVTEGPSTVPPSYERDYTHPTSSYDDDYTVGPTTGRPYYPEDPVESVTSTPDYDRYEYGTTPPPYPYYNPSEAPRDYPSYERDYSQETSGYDDYNYNTQSTVEPEPMTYETPVPDYHRDYETYHTEAPAPAFDTWAPIGPTDTPSYPNDEEPEAPAPPPISGEFFSLESEEAAAPAPHHRKISVGITLDIEKRSAEGAKGSEEKESEETRA